MDLRLLERNLRQILTGVLVLASGLVSFVLTPHSRFRSDRYCLSLFNGWLVSSLENQDSDGGSSSARS
ncbi:hypothetical protein [Nostoc sp. LEGE 12450]|uniref:hypothetical protein n=1 Tax=Nostoc sp. LEGE 12450 TaxID=1828643 RepID=UPI00187F4D01|nr:hypothetical protein [Nostoc sp. LEGE 12450]MBE8989941.1 hypothetical protein [Nostoc sp. LEGE 12450]